MEHSTSDKKPHGFQTRILIGVGFWENRADSKNSPGTSLIKPWLGSQVLLLKQYY